jgi:hypothetical protein
MNVEVMHDGVIYFKIRHSLIDIRYFKSGILPRFVYKHKQSLNTVGVVLSLVQVSTLQVLGKVPCFGFLLT